MTSKLAMTMAFTALLLVGCGATQPATPHPVPESDLWLTYEGGEGPGAGKHVVLIAAEQEYRSEQALPMLARTLAKHHGFHCTVLFLTNADGLVDVTEPSPVKQEDKYNRVPGLEHLASADCLIWMSRFLKLTDEDADHLYGYFDSGKPIIALRTANHGLRGTKPYVVNGKDVSLREMLGGVFMNHHGGWKQEATLGIPIQAQKNHPILTGIGEGDVWGTTDVYRCHKDGEFPADCTALLLGQPMKSLERDAPPNTEKPPLPIAWTKEWVGNQGSKVQQSRILHYTMGSAKDFENEGVRRVTINGVYWGMRMQDRIDAGRSVAIVGDYEPMKDGFNYEKLGVKPVPASTFR